MFNKDKKFLTEKNGVGGFELKICMSCDPGENNEKCGLCQFMQDAVERLGEYEATGLSPKEVKKLAKKRETEAKGKKLPVFDTNDPDCGDKIEKYLEEGEKE